MVTTTPPGALLGHFQRAGDGRYTMSVLNGAIVFDLDRLRRDRHELQGELLVRCALAGARTVDGVLSAADFNVSSQRARTDRAKFLLDRALTKPGDVDWTQLIEEFCQRVITFERQGAEAKRLKDIPLPDTDDAFHVDGVALLERQPVVLFGDGGHGKSLLALYFAGKLAQRGGRVLYADWEFDAGAHRTRYEAIFGDQMPAEVWYARCDRPLAVEADRLHRLALQHQAHYLVCDSVVFACDGPPESAEAATHYYQALRQIGLGSLNVAHTTKSNGETGEIKRQQQKPFGSVFWANGARATWFMQQGDISDHGFKLGLYPRKASTGKLGRAVGFSVEFNGDGHIAVNPSDVRDSVELSADLPVWQRMAVVLRSGAKTMAVIAAELDLPVNTVVQTVKRHEHRAFIRILNPNGIQTIGLRQND